MINKITQNLEFEEIPETLVVIDGKVDQTDIFIDTEEWFFVVENSIKIKVYKDIEYININKYAQGWIANKNSKKVFIGKDKNLTEQLISRAFSQLVVSHG